ncbi:MAG: enoyl-CoA hydratase [Acidimicrobiales bacterium]|nr:enoyl-CoA hydratase [Acidimicrobiales bacterium]
MELVLVDRPAEGVVLVTLNRPEARNALSVGLREAASDAIRAAGEDERVGAVVLTGAGAAFSAGVDLKELGAPGGPPKPSSRGADDMVRAIVECPKPVIGAINGLAITGGFELAIACDIILASSEARFADTHARVGILPRWGISQRLPRLIGMSRAKQLSFSGDFCDAATAERWGLVNQVFEPERLLPEAIALAAAIAGNDRRAVANLKRVYDGGALLSMEEGLKLEKRLADEHMASVRPEDIAARRAAVQARNRAQASGDS